MKHTEKENKILRTLKNLDDNKAMTAQEISKETGLEIEETKEMIYDLWTQGFIDAMGTFYEYSAKMRKMQAIAEAA